MDKQTFLSLVDKIANGTATEADMVLYNQYYTYFQQKQEGEWNEAAHGVSAEEGKLLQERINRSIDVSVIPLYKRTWLRVAAIVLLAAGSALFMLSHNNNAPSFTQTNNNHTARPLLPGSNKAVLTLDNGSTVVLDETSNGTIASQGNSKVLKLNGGELAYESASARSSAAKVTYNTLSTPNGGQYQVVLPDGTTVWLNASSSLRFPTAFTGNERRVELKGEAYFEVTKNPNMPFKVAVNNMEAIVLGTHFNIMAYEEEGAVKTSLLEGSVRVKNDKASILLIPGQQSQLDKKGSLTVVKDADMEEALAWKNGLFYFDGADVESVMRQLSRWYDVDIEYRHLVDQHFTGKINRNVDASKVLQMLELTEKVHFTVEGKKIIVSQ